MDRKGGNSAKPPRGPQILSSVLHIYLPHTRSIHVFRKGYEYRNLYNHLLFSEMLIITHNFWVTNSLQCLQLNVLAFSITLHFCIRLKLILFMPINKKPHVILTIQTNSHRFMIGNTKNQITICNEQKTLITFKYRKR